MNLIKIMLIIIFSPIILIFNRKKSQPGIKEYDENGNVVDVIDRCPIHFVNGKVVPTLRVLLTETPNKNKHQSYKSDVDSLLRWVTK